MGMQAFHRPSYINGEPYGHTQIQAPGPHVEQVLAQGAPQQKLGDHHHDRLLARSDEL